MVMGLGILLASCAELARTDQALVKSPTMTISEPAKTTTPTPAVIKPVLKQGLPMPPWILEKPQSYGNDARLRGLSTELSTQHGMDAAWVESVLKHAQFNPKVTQLIMPKSSSGYKNWHLYKSRFIEPIRIKNGVQFWQEHRETIDAAAQEYGVPASIIVGIIGVETIYGRYQGDFSVLDVLSTLSLDFPTGRSDRSAFFKNELGEFLRMCAEQELDPREVEGSYAGAIGLPQFMPSSIRRFAVDFDKSGHINLKNSPADAIGSVAHYLKLHGWQKGMPTHYPITPPTAPDALNKLLGPDITPSFKPSEMRAMGAVLEPQGSAHAGLLALVKLENGTDAATYVAGTDNFYVITRYNQSSYYAMAVIELAEALQSAM
jgi:membrane-bound lytic murein transglycosylase B